MNKLDNLSDARAEALEARFALRVGARLHEGATQLPHDISERLRVARLQALDGLAAAARAAEPARPAVAAADAVGQIQLAGAGRGSDWSLAPWQAPLHDDPLPWRWRLASVLPVLVLVLGLWGIHVWHKQAQVQATSEVDMALLTDDLPPAAYADPGFAEFLRQPSAPEQPQAQDLPLQVDDLIQEALELSDRSRS